MANACRNYLTIEGSKESLQRIRDELRQSPDDCLSFRKHVPLDQDSDYLNAWGTRDVEGEEIDFSDQSEEETPYLSYTFDTAWSPPCAWLSTVVSLFPDLTFRMSYEEPGCSLYGISLGSGGDFSDNQLTLHEHLLENDETYPFMIKEVESFSQEELVKFFSGTSSFEACCNSDEEWNDALKEEFHWGQVSMYDYKPLAEIIVERIDTKSLPLFLGVDWGEKANKIFKGRLK